MKKSRPNTAVGSSGQRSASAEPYCLHFHCGVIGGSLTLHVQKDSPGAGKEANWLPASEGPFYCIMRIYMPKPAEFNGQWQPPPLQRGAEV